MRKLFLVLAGVIITAWVSIAMASVPKGANTAMRFVDNLSQNAIDTLGDKSISQTERERRFKVLLNQNFDIPFLGRFSLGRYWRSASMEQQQEYLRLFEQIIVNTYANRFSQYNGQTIEVISSQDEPDSTLVSTRLVQPDGGEPVYIDWRLRRDGNNFRIIDLIVEGVSLSVTQRSEYGSVIERAGGDIEALLVLLRKKTAAS